MMSGLTLERVVSLHRDGDLSGAEQGYRTLISENLYHPVLYGNLAVICHHTGRIDEAIKLFLSSLELNADKPDTHFNLGAAYEHQRRLQDAVASYQKALELRPDYPEASNNLGFVLLEQGRLEEAISSLRKAIVLRPDYFEAHFNLGLALHAQGSLEDAIWSYRKALKLKPDYPQAYLNLGHIARSRDSANAITYYRKAIELRPDYAEAYYFLGLIFSAQRKLDDATDCFRKVAALKPDFPETHDRLGFVLREQNRVNEAIAAKCRALELRSANIEENDRVRKLGQLLIELDRFPVIYKDSSDIDRYRNHYTSCISEAKRLVSKRELAAAERDILKRILFRLNNFYLGYQHKNDRELLISFARLATEILRPEIEEFLAARKVAHANHRIRLGIASENLRTHNGSFWAYNWIANLPRKDYELFFYSLDGLTDGLTGRFAALGTYRWLPFTPDSYVQCLQVIKEDNLDVLLITDIGLTANNLILSLCRLAPIQCTAWGHPMTSGSPNIDYFLSSELMESEQAEHHYSEQLIRLPNIGIDLDHPTVPSQVSSRADFGIPQGKTVFGSLQSLFKYLPQYDFLYPAIAKQVPNAFFVFVEHESENVMSAFRERLKNAFEEGELRFEKYVKFLPRTKFSKFQQLLRVIDVNLDSIGWSGGITTKDSLAMDCPVVTLPGELMRSRLSYGMLKMIGVEELIANSLDEYISLSVRIGLERTWRRSIVDKIKARKHRLFNDKECTEFLDRFLKSKVAEVRTNSDKWSESRSGSQLAS